MNGYDYSASLAYVAWAEYGEPTLGWVWNHGGDLLRIGFGAFDVVTGVPWSATSLGAIAGVPLAAYGVDQVITGTRNIAYGKRDRAGVEELVYAATGSETAAVLLPAAATLSLWAIGPRLARVGVRAGAGSSGNALLGGAAPPPSGPESEALRAMFLSNAASTRFRFKAYLWSHFNGMGRIDWAAFTRQLEQASYREFADFRQGLRSLGWAGPNPHADLWVAAVRQAEFRSLGWAGPHASGQWLFGVPNWLRRIPLIGRASVQHELIHALQDFKYGLFALDETKIPFLFRGVSIESAAHAYGGTVIGVGAGSVVLVAAGGVIYIIYVVGDTVVILTGW